LNSALFLPTEPGPTPEVAVTLQGTLDSFSLPEVLDLLSQGRTGRLSVEGEGGRGDLHLEDGHLLGGETDTRADGTPLPEVVFELLRLEGGRFSFDERASVGPSSGRAVEVGPVVAKAQELLAEWRDVEAVVPSAAATVRLAEDLPEAHVDIDHRRWRTLQAVAGGATVGAAGRALGLDDIGACRAVKDLVDAGLAVVEDGRPNVEGNGRAPWSSERSRTPEPVPMATSGSWRDYLEDEGRISAVARGEAPGAASAPSPSATAASDIGPGRSPSWAGDDVLDEAFAEWVPGPSPEAHPEERRLLDLDAPERADDGDRGLIDKLLASLRA
jgi:Domain of unknown function (DUF4388)